MGAYSPEGAGAPRSTSGQALGLVRVIAGDCPLLKASSPMLR